MYSYTKTTRVPGDRIGRTAKLCLYLQEVIEQMTCERRLNDGRASQRVTSEGVVFVFIEASVSLDRHSVKQIIGFWNSVNLKYCGYLASKLETYFNILTGKLLFTMQYLLSS